MRTRGIVIKKTDFKEYDQLVTFYTEDFGKIKGVAKSVLKPNSKQAYHLDVLNLVDFELVNGNGYPIITSSVSENCHFGIKSKLIASSLAFIVADMVYKMTYENDPDPLLWSFLKEILNYLDKSSAKLSKDNFKPVLAGIQKKFYSILGFYDLNSGSLRIPDEFSMRSIEVLQFLNDVVQ